MPAIKILVVVSLPETLAWSQAPPQQISSLDRGRAPNMLRTLASEVRKHYYDPKFNGVDWDAKVAEAKQKIDTAVLDTLNDTHIFFLPPEHSCRHEYEDMANGRDPVLQNC